jgi:hypothetical protein
MGLRQMLPVQTKRMVFIPDSMGIKLGVAPQNVNGEIHLEGLFEVVLHMKPWTNYSLGNPHESPEQNDNPSRQTHDETTCDRDQKPGRKLRRRMKIGIEHHPVTARDEADRQTAEPHGMPEQVVNGFKLPLRRQPIFAARDVDQATGQKPNAIAHHWNREGKSDSESHHVADM